MNGGVLIDLGRQIFVRNFYLKFIAIILTLALYIWVSEDRETVVAAHAPVQMVVPDDMMLVSEPLDRVTVTIRGRWSDIDRFDTGDMDPIRLDLSPADDETVVSITPDMIRVPPALRVTDVEPDNIYVELEPEITRTVPLEPQVSGSAADSYTVEDIRVRPETITIRGPQSRVEQIDEIQTERVDISGQTDSIEREVRPRIEDGLVTAELDEPIVVTVDIETEEITETLSAIPVEGVNTRYRTTVEPAEADVTVYGPQSTIEQLDLDLIRGEIDLTEEDERPPGAFSRGAEVVNLPSDVEFRRIHPERFRVTTEAVAESQDDDIADGDGDDADL